MQSLIEECPSLLLGAGAYTQAALVEILKQPACQKIAAAILSASTSNVDPTESLLTQSLTQKRSNFNSEQDLMHLNTTAAMLLATISGDINDSDLLPPPNMRILLTVVFAILSILGVIGNLMVITVVLKVPGMITPTNCYLMSLAASDCLFFLGAAPTEITGLHPISSYVFGPVGCAVFTYTPYLAINTSSLSITAFTIERFIGICYPLRARYICTVSRAKLIIVLIWIFCIVYNSPWLYLASITEDDQGTMCDFKLDRGSWAYKLLYFFDFTTFYLIPMVLYVVIYAKITYTLTACSLSAKGRQPFRKLPTNGEPPTLHKYSISSAQQPLEPKKSLTTAPNEDLARNSFINTGRKGSSRGRVQVQVIKMLAVVVLIFAVCWLPYRAMVMYNSFATVHFRPLWYLMFSKTLIFFNCAINPILYNVMSARFRNAFRRLLRGRKADSKMSKRNCTVTLSRPLTATTSMRPDDLHPFLSPSNSSPEHENGSAGNLTEKL